MKKLITICAVVTMILAVSGVAQASVTFSFDPDDLIQAYPNSAGGDLDGKRKDDQLNARRLHQSWANTYYETFSNPADTQPQPASYNTYMNWRDSLGAGEGIAMFNTWFLDNGAARSWGETVVVKPGTQVTGTTSGNWQMRIITDPYGLGGACVQWWTLDADSRINTLSDIDDFSVTADLYWDLNANGWDESDIALTTGDSARFWVGNLNGDDSMFYRDDTQALYFDDEGWGDLEDGIDPFGALYSTGAGNYGSGFEGALEATVTTVPVPGAFLLGGIGVSLVGWMKRRRSL